MTLSFLRLYGIGLVTCFALDLLWLGLVARGFYQQQLGPLLRADVRWIPAVLFYLIYVAALVVFVARPAANQQALSHVLLLGAFFGFAAYAAFDLTGLALLRDFPVRAAVVDLLWGAALSSVVSTVVYVAARAGI
jgi:uncharacterized membrane protein